jgi:hypothetical protein
VRILLFPVFLAFALGEVVAWAFTGRKPWRSPGRPTCGTHVLGWLGFDVSEED